MSGAETFGFDDSVVEAGTPAVAPGERDLQRLREMLIEGRDSEFVGFFDKAYFDGLRERLGQRAGA